MLYITGRGSRRGRHILSGRNSPGRDGRGKTRLITSVVDRTTIEFRGCVVENGVEITELLVTKSFFMLNIHILMTVNNLLS